MNWHNVKKVVCIDDSGSISRYVTKGKVYPLRAVVPGCCISKVLLDIGIDWHSKCYCTSCGKSRGSTLLFTTDRFRPVIEADLSAELAETFLKGQPPSEQEVYNPQYA